MAASASASASASADADAEAKLRSEYAIYKKKPTIKGYDTCLEIYMGFPDYMKIPQMRPLSMEELEFDASIAMYNSTVRCVMGCGRRGQDLVNIAFARVQEAYEKIPQELVKYNKKPSKSYPIEDDETNGLATGMSMMMGNLGKM